MVSGISLKTMWGGWRWKGCWGCEHSLCAPLTQSVCLMFSLLHGRRVQPYALGPAWRPLCSLDFTPPLALPRLAHGTPDCSLLALPWAGGRPAGLASAPDSPFVHTGPVLAPTAGRAEGTGRGLGLARALQPDAVSWASPWPSAMSDPRLCMSTWCCSLGALGSS